MFPDKHPIHSCSLVTALLKVNVLRPGKELFTGLQHWCRFLTIFISHYSFQWAIRGKILRPNQFYSLLCFARESLGGFLRRKSLKTFIVSFIIICLFYFPICYWETNWETYTLWGKERTFSLGYLDITAQSYTFYWATVFTSAQYLLFYSLSYFLSSEKYLVSLSWIQALTTASNSFKFT